MPVKNFCEAANALRAAVHDIAVDALHDPDAVYAVRFDCCDVDRVAFSLSATSAFVLPCGDQCVVRWTASDEVESETAYLVALSAVEEGCEIYPEEA
jgi:hypothetical protein